MAECPHDDLMAEAEEEGFSDYRVCLREEGLSTSNITPAFLDAAKDILKNN